MLSKCCFRKGFISGQINAGFRALAGHFNSVRFRWCG
nr:MAG TPA: hypothetical protein [Caudoviricetes sp.]